MVKVHQVNKKKEKNSPAEGIVDASDFVELKRDMQSAKIVAWLEYNQQQLIAAAIVLVVGLVGVSWWKEQQKAEKNAAALLYMQAVNAQDKSEKKALLDKVDSAYADTGYALLAKLQKLPLSDEATKQALLRQIMQAEVAPEFIWQARLDLAELLLQEGKQDEAAELLEQRLGKQYEQARYALLASMAQDKDQKIAWIQKALDAPSHDNDLAASLQAELASLQLGQ